MKFNVIDETQHGSRPNKSLVIAAASFIESVDIGQITLSVNMDLSKAFDRVKHQVLLERQSESGVSKLALRWFMNIYDTPLKHTISR